MDWNEFSTKRILEVKQRIQTIVIYEVLKDDNGRDTPVTVEAVVDSFDRPIQASYT